MVHSDEIYIVSSNFDFLLKPLQKRWNLAGIIATRTEVLNGIFTGRLVGNACHGKEKVARVIECFGPTITKEAVAYGDSASDAFLLDSVKDGYSVKPNNELVEVEASQQNRKQKIVVEVNASMDSGISNDSGLAVARGLLEYYRCPEEYATVSAGTSEASEGSQEAGPF